MTPYGKAPFRGTYDGVAANAPKITYKFRGTTTPLVTGAAAVKLIKAAKVTFDDAGEPEPQTDGNGKINGYIDKKSMDKITLECIVQADSKANAAANVILPGIYQVIVLEDFVANNQTFMNGDWIYTRGAKVELSDSEDEDAKLTIPLERHFTDAGVLIPCADLILAIV